MNNVPRMLSIPETAAAFGLSQYAVRMLLLSGKVHGLRIGRGKLLCNCDDLTRYLSESYANESEPENQTGGIQPVRK